MSLSQILESHRPALLAYEVLYRALHQNPELSNVESETAQTITKHLREISPDFQIRNVGGHGVVAELQNGPGLVVLLRADMDALPVEERTGLPYASTKCMLDASGAEQPVMHACGHDMHMASLLGCADLMVSARQQWHGTLVFAFQPAEERGTGAQSMVDDGLYPATSVPDVVFSGHVVPARAGVVGIRAGTMASSCDNLRVTFHGRGGHASMPERLVDPIVMAASAVLRLQTLVSREIAPSEHAVVSCASFHAGGAAENVVGDDATITIDVRATTEETRKKLLDGVLRIVRAESAASNATAGPTVVKTRSFPVTHNDELLAKRIGKAFGAHFGPGEHSYVDEYPKLSFSEDFSILASAVDKPSLLFAYGCMPPDRYDAAASAGRLAEDIPSNHSALFAPQIMPTLRVGIDAYALCALEWLAGRGSGD